MCVNSLNTKTVCKKTAKNLVVSNLCVNTHTHTYIYIYIYSSPYSITDITSGNNSVVQLRELQLSCSPRPCCACILPIATFCLT